MFISSICKLLVFVRALHLATLLNMWLLYFSFLPWNFLCGQSCHLSGDRFIPSCPVLYHGVSLFWPGCSSWSSQACPESGRARASLFHPQTQRESLQSSPQASCVLPTEMLSFCRLWTFCSIPCLVRFFLKTGMDIDYLCQLIFLCQLMWLYDWFSKSGIDL